MNARDASGPASGQRVSPYAGHAFGLEAPTGRRSVRGPTLFVLLMLAGLAIAAIIKVLGSA